MAWSWDDYNAELARVLDDEGADPIYPDAIRLDGLTMALRTFAGYHPRQAKTTEYTVSEIAFPIDCYRIVSVVAPDVDGEQATLTQVTIGNPGDTLDADGTYWVWDSVVYLGAEYDEISLYYQAYYPDPVLGDPDIAVPTWARDAIVYRAAAHCLVPSLIGRARLGAYHDRADAPPLQNSLIQAADWCIAQFERVMAEHKQVRP
jgi:hypothetical protein